ncbi:hypothetical protein QTO34_019544 [Cnephaeus nilssonii]|uniref:G-protein coupled receptors family 1 profile domain-containing protein n=1 Tax=Cnephaeus nilssonii TaxID=3371016 RepID=A0AA40HXX1_CNENI|nr:hypothetical protein QTO34_019544 [Eptesicus nilssonii]
MAFDRYIAICRPLHYSTVMNPRACYALLLALWLGGFVHSIIQVALILRLPFCGPNQLDNFFCDVPQVIKLACTDIFVVELLMVFNSGLMTLLCFLGLLASYAVIICRLCHRDHTILKGRVAVIGSLYIPGLYNHNAQGTAANPGTPDLKQHKYADSDELCTFSWKGRLGPPPPPLPSGSLMSPPSALPGLRGNLHPLRTPPRAPAAQPPPDSSPGSRAVRLCRLVSRGLQMPGLLPQRPLLCRSTAQRPAGPITAPATLSPAPCASRWPNRGRSGVMMIMDFFAQRKTISFEGCVSQIFLLHLFTGTEIVLLISMSFDSVPVAGKILQ